MAKKKLLKKNKDFVARDFDGEVVLMPVVRQSKDAEFIYSLNDAAKFIWDKVDGKSTEEDICTKVLKKFEVDEKEASKKVSKIIKELKKIKALV